MENVYIDEHLSITKLCHYVKCEIESLFDLRFTYNNESIFTYNNVSFIAGWIYRHPNQNSSHFVKDLDRS